MDTTWKGVWRSGHFNNLFGCAFFIQCTMVFPVCVTGFIWNKLKNSKKMINTSAIGYLLPMMARKIRAITSIRWPDCSFSTCWHDDVWTIILSTMDLSLIFRMTKKFIIPTTRFIRLIRLFCYWFFGTMKLYCIQKSTLLKLILRQVYN